MTSPRHLGDVNAGIPWPRLTCVWAACACSGQAARCLTLSLDPTFPCWGQGASAVLCSTGHYNILGAYGIMGQQVEHQHIYMLNDVISQA